MSPPPAVLRAGVFRPSFFPQALGSDSDAVEH
jgi:hypothetical protein